MRPIDADELEKYMTDIMPENTSSAYIKGIIEILTHLINFIRKEMPTIEAEPVRHGRWIEESACEYYCSYCGKYAPIAKNMRHCDCSKWCKECGTNMGATDTNVGGKGGADNG